MMDIKGTCKNKGCQVIRFLYIGYGMKETIQGTAVRIGIFINKKNV